MSLLFLLTGIGVINGFFAGIYLIIKKPSAVTHWYFSGLVLSLSIRIAKSVYYYFNREADLLILQIGLSACVFIGPFFFLYLKSIDRQNEKSSKTYLLLLIGLLLAIIITGIIFPYRNHPDVWNGYIIYGIYATWIIYTIRGLLIYLQIRNASTEDQHNRAVLAVIVTSMIFITVTYQLALFIGITYIWGSLIFSFTFYWLAARVVLMKQPIATKTRTALPENATEIMQTVEQMMKEQKIYLKKGLRLDEVAKEAGVTRQLLSMVINECYGSGFSQYVRSYRIEEAKRLLHSRSELSLEGIGYEAGFHSKSTFFEAFKKTTGMTPAVYKKQHSENATS